MIQDILEQHAEEAAFLWILRDAAAAAPHYRRADLDDLDERIDAHLDGLRVGGDAALSIALDALGSGEPGEVFPAAALAIERGDAVALRKILDLAAPDPALRRPLASALAWAPAEAARGALRPLLASSAPPLHRRLGIAASALRREDPGAAISFAVLDADPALRARALRAAGELGRADLLRELRDGLRDADPACRFWSAWSCALLGDPAAAPVLWQIAGAGGPHAAAACAMAARCTEPARARAALEPLLAAPSSARAAVIGAGALGDPACAPWLIERLRAPSLARIAAEALSMLTGIAVERDLEGERPADFNAGPSDDPADTNVAMDPDDRLPWPAPDAATHAFQSHVHAMRRGVRHLLGEPIAQPSAGRVLRDGTQRQRAAAAIELALLRPGGPLAEVRAPAAGRSPA